MTFVRIDTYYLDNVAMAEMEKQNVTLSLPKDLLRKARILAIERNTSLSKLLAQALTELTSEADAYAAAQERNLFRLENAPDLGSNGQLSWSRDELHERLSGVS